MAKPRLHLDADTSKVSLYRALLGATGQGRSIFTFNMRDFIPLAKRYPRHGGIILSRQRPTPELLKALDRPLAEADGNDWPGQVRWLSDWTK